MMSHPKMMKKPHLWMKKVPKRNQRKFSKRLIMFMLLIYQRKGNSKRQIKHGFHLRLSLQKKFSKKENISMMNLIWVNNSMPKVETSNNYLDKSQLINFSNKTKLLMTISLSLLNLSDFNKTQPDPPMIHRSSKTLALQMSKSKDLPICI